ncbi:CDP-glycerol glycerophosphotransferase family protein [uncultured Eubacterium sp.]|uniref:CDP-glycerol glycerophosphotransferase family protein n=1 Tax=uncultured Eubacterium sp. TaxID=165185 RepID=UPI0026183869|nr:CDP-glycerol glycerophosphotransferase family protein [uncultured Eubacterium sp.]
MQKYRLEIDNIFVEKGKLNIEAIAEFEINPLATVPKIRLLFCGQGQTRRFPLPVQECTKENGICKAKAQYSYNLYYLFYEQTLTEPAVLTFDLAYGADEYEAVDFTVKSHDNEHLKLDGNRVIIDNKIKYHKQHFGLQDLTKRSTYTITLKKPIVKFLNIYYKKYWKMPVKMNRVTFISGRRSELSGNEKFVYDKLKDIKGIDFQFLMFSSAKGHYNIENIKRFFELYTTSRVVIVDDYFRMLNIVPKKDDVKLFQLWHACGAFKTFGFTRIGKDGGPRQWAKNHRMYDYAVVSSKNIAKHYAEGFGIPDSCVLPSGVPRTDIFCDSKYKEKTRAAFFEKYPQLKNKKIILFAPTFRGKGQMSAYYPTDKFNPNEICSALGDEYAIIIKLHPFCKEKYRIEEKYKDRIIDLSNADELNDLLFVTDLLITDYSSVVFEASLLDIPMLFYAFDLDEYIENRDFYYDFKEFIPGKTVFLQDELIKAVQSNDFESEKVEKFKHKFFDDIDGQSSQRVANKIISLLNLEN